MQALFGRRYTGKISFVHLFPHIVISVGQLRATIPLSGTFTAKEIGLTNVPVLPALSVDMTYREYPVLFGMNAAYVVAPVVAKVAKMLPFCMTNN